MSDKSDQSFASLRICEELVERRHDLRASASHELPHSVLCVSLPLVEVLKHSRGSVLFVNPEMI